MKSAYAFSLRGHAGRTSSNPAHKAGQARENIGQNRQRWGQDLGVDYVKKGEMIPMNVESNAQADRVFNHIVVPHDLTVRSNRAVQLAGTMAHPLRSKVALIHVIDLSDWRGKGLIHFMNEVADLARDRWRFLQIAAKRLLPAEVKFDVRILSGDPQDVILTEARKLGADLLIITAHPLTGAGYPFSGGSVEHIPHQAPCPVLFTQVSEEDEASLVEQEMGDFHPHNLNQSREFSRLLSSKQAYRPVYIGYSRLPASPLGVCR